VNGGRRGEQVKGDALKKVSFFYFKFVLAAAIELHPAEKLRDLFRLHVIFEPQSRKGHNVKLYVRRVKRRALMFQAGGQRDSASTLGLVPEKGRGQGRS